MHNIEPIVLPDLRTPIDYATDSCKHECAVLKQPRHVRQTHEVWREGLVMQRALMLSRVGQFGLDIAKVSTSEVEAVATMPRPPNYEHVDLCEGSLYNASSVPQPSCLHGLPYDYASFDTEDLPTYCPTCNAALTDPLRPEPMHMRMFTWLSHLGRCRGDERCLQAREIAKLFLRGLPSLTLTRGEALSRSNQPHSH